ncbi:hypothetical protein ACFSTC_12430 [Nonomuraea ferruginea]
MYAEAVDNCVELVLRRSGTDLRPLFLAETSAAPRRSRRPARPHRRGARGSRPPGPRRGGPPLPLHRRVRAGAAARALGRHPGPAHRLQPRRVRGRVPGGGSSPWRTRCTSCSNGRT